MHSNLLSSVELEPPARADSCVIWLHGLGADGHDFEPIVPQLDLPAQHGVRFIFPHAPSRPVSINNGYIMPAWFDILSLERLHPVDATGILQSVQQINGFVEREQERGINASRIVLAGFSQGGVIALHCALRYPHTLAGVLALSTYLPLAEELTKSRSAMNISIPIFMAHGLYDEVLAFELGDLSRQALLELGYTVDWHRYAMGHQVCLEEIQAIGEWLQQRLLG